MSGAPLDRDAPLGGWTRETVRVAILSGADAARREERKRCASICRDYAHRHAKDDNHSKAQAWMMLQCAAAIEKEDLPQEAA